MKSFIVILCFFMTSMVNADIYELEPVEKPQPTKVEKPIEIEVDNGIIILDSLDDVEEVIDHTKEKIEYYKDLYLYLFSGAGLTVGGFLSRIGYLYYQTKRGKLIVKHVKNHASNLEDDIIDSISKITDLETGEDLRARLESLEKQLLEIAKQKLPPKPPEES